MEKRAVELSEIPWIFFPPRWLKLAALGVVATVLGFVTSLYLEPTFLVTLATQVWACF